MAENDLITSAENGPLAKKLRLTHPLENRLKKIADFAKKTSHIHVTRVGPARHSYIPRYVNLRTQDMFDNLVELYTNVFMFKWERYKHRLEFYPPPTGVSPTLYAARCYISMWFIDLYVANRNAVRELSFIEHYAEQLRHTCHEYDYYLALLNASIRPTYLEYNLDSAVYMPIIAECVNVDDSNPFGIDNFTPKEICYKFSMSMRGISLGHSTPLSKDAMGRPWWLFDWQSSTHVYSWFASEGNYDVEDVTLAYVLGTACTPNLGPSNVDEWQYFADGVVPKNMNPLSYSRVAERKFYGCEEFRTMEVDEDFSLTRTLAAATAEGKVNDQPVEEAQEDHPLTPRFRLIDWVYHDRVICHMDKQLRDRLHAVFLYDLPEAYW